MLIGLVCNVEYKAIVAESGSAHGLYPRLAFLDQVGQVLCPHDAFIEAIETAHEARKGSVYVGFGGGTVHHSSRHQKAEVRARVSAHRAAAKDYRTGRRGVSVCDLCSCADWLVSTYAKCK